MNKQFYLLLIAQFLSAFADNAVLFTVIAMVMQGTQVSWYVPALQSVFLIAFVALAPWVGDFADKHAKARVLLIANLVKALGAGLLFFQIEPLIGYCVVGIGAALYSPAKYGILPELAGHSQLVKANSWIEGSTIVAILLGMTVGAKVADYSISIALSGAIILFILSALTTLTLPVNIATKAINHEPAKIILFIKQIGTFFTTQRARFAILGGALFWATAATLRVVLVAWSPFILNTKTASEIAQLTLFLAIGIIVGSAIVVRLISIEQLRRVRLAAYSMAICITVLSFVTQTTLAQAVLFCIGTLGGIFIVPINAVLQEHGKLSIGSGRAVALQGFFQNFAMLLAVGIYTFASSQNINPVTAMFSLGIIVLIGTFLVAELGTKQLNAPIEK